LAGHFLAALLVQGEPSALWLDSATELEGAFFTSRCCFILNRPSLLHVSSVQRWGIDEQDASVPQSRRFLAVPFLGLDVPSTNSEFSNPEVCVCC
jgi:hypothetical protein